MGKFGSLDAVNIAEKHELMSVAGIGNQVAGGIKSVVKEQGVSQRIDEDFPTGNSPSVLVSNI